MSKEDHRMKIGIFAGTFDPIHDGHIAFARAALAQGLEKVYFLPEPRPRRKQGVRALEHRVAMIEHAIAQESQFGAIKLEQARFTPHETMPVLQERFRGAQLVLLFGDDVITHIAGWPQVHELIESVELLVAVRHHNQASLTERFLTLKQVSGLDFRYQLVDPGHAMTSSSRVRAQLRGGEHPTGVDQAVWRYIKQSRLYRPRK
jgi:nicotinate-nucleotide adenylyltransferase